MAMRASKKKLREIAAEFPGRTISGVYNLLKLKEPPCKWENGRFDILARLGQDDEAKINPPPAYLIEEAILRALFPRTPTMKLCGDPVLNQQALYVQQHGERL
jgi:hypothetical protein